MKRVKIIVNILLTFLVMILIISSTILTTINNFISKEKLISKLEEIDIYKQIYLEVQDGFENYIYQSGLEFDTIQKICDEEKVKNDFLSIVDQIYGGEEVSIDTKVIRDDLDKEVSEAIKKQDRKLTVEEEENIQKFEDMMVNSYGETISSYLQISKVIGNGKINTIVDSITNVKNIVIVVAIILIVLLVVLGRKNIFSPISYIGISLLASGFVLVFIKGIVLGKIDIDNIILFTKTMSSAFSYLVKEFLFAIHSSGIWYICLGIFTIVMTDILRVDEYGKKQEDAKLNESKEKKEKNKKKEKKLKEKKTKKKEKEDKKDKEEIIEKTEEKKENSKPERTKKNKKKKKKSKKRRH